MKVIGYFLVFIGVACLLFAAFYQMALVYEKFGFILTGDTQIFIPHWSAYFYLGIIPFVAGIAINKKEDYR